MGADPDSPDLELLVYEAQRLMGQLGGGRADGVRAGLAAAVTRRERGPLLTAIDSAWVALGEGPVAASECHACRVRRTRRVPLVTLQEYSTPRLDRLRALAAGYDPAGVEVLIEVIGHHVVILGLTDVDPASALQPESLWDESGDSQPVVRTPPVQ